MGKYDTRGEDGKFTGGGGSSGASFGASSSAENASTVRSTTKVVKEELGFPSSATTSASGGEVEYKGSGPEADSFVASVSLKAKNGGFSGGYPRQVSAKKVGREFTAFKTETVWKRGNFTLKIVGDTDVDAGKTDYTVTLTHSGL